MTNGPVMVSVELELLQRVRGLLKECAEDLVTEVDQRYELLPNTESLARRKQRDLTAAHQAIEVLAVLDKTWGLNN